jgi:hypothetical protein
MPANNGLRLDENQRLLPSRPEPFKRHPEQPVESSKSRLWMSLLQDRKLLPKRQVLQKQIAAGPKELSYLDRQKPQRAQHETSLQSIKSSWTFSHLTDWKINRYFGKVQVTES